MVAYMPDIEKQTKNFIVRSRKANIVFTGVSTNGALPFFLLLVMIPWNVPSAGIKWSFWNFILTISVFPSKNYMRDLCPDLAESVLLHNFLCFYGIIPS